MPGTAEESGRDLENAEAKTLEQLTPTQLSILALSIFVVALCAIAYELIIGAVSSYLLGNSVYQFSLTIGLFMFAMGLGSFFSKAFHRNLVRNFVIIELIIAVVGGGCGLLLFLVFPMLHALYKPVMVSLIIIIGALVGLEIPILTRILSHRKEFRVSIAHVLSVDYFGALAGSLLFPLVLLPHLGLVRSSFAIGLLNVFVALFNIWVFRHYWKSFRVAFGCGLVVAVLLIAATIWGTVLTSFAERSLYYDQIIFKEQTPYQRIVFTRENTSKNHRLYIDGHIQFSESDEYRYHEALVHPCLAQPGPRSRVLVLGGGDGMAAREILKWPDVEHIDVVDIDPAITRVCSTVEPILRINGDSLNDPRVEVHNEDAFRFLNQYGPAYDRIISDLPDPHNEALNNLYSREFYNIVRKRLAPTGVLVVQSSSPFATRKTFWTIASTIEAARLETLSFHVTIPSFGLWGFHLASASPLEKNLELPNEIKTRFLDPKTFLAARTFGRDLARLDTDINSMHSPKLFLLYIEELQGGAVSE